MSVAAGGVEGDLRVGLVAGGVASLELVFGLSDGHQAAPGFVQFALDAQHLGPEEEMNSLHNIILMITDADGVILQT